MTVGRGLAGLLVFLAGCQSAPRVDYLEYRAEQDPVTVASRLAEAVRACWFDGARAGFADSSYAPELNSFAGRPRVLIVPKDDPAGLPRLVIEATEAERGTSVKLFGPMLASAEGPGIADDVRRWAAGASDC